MCAYVKKIPKKSAPLIFQHPIATVRQGSSDLYALYAVHACASGWMWKFLLNIRQSANIINLFVPKFRRYTCTCTVCA